MGMHGVARRWRLVFVAGAGAVTLLAAGCGSSGSSSNPWTKVSSQHDPSADFTIVRGDVGQPSQVEVTVVTKPQVTATTHWTIACGSTDYAAKNKSGPTGMTPLTFRVGVPKTAGPPSSCFVVGGANYPKNVDSTITILQRDAPTTTTTTP